MLRPYRAVGRVCSSVAPATVRRLGDAKNFVTVPVGSSFYVYDASSLLVALVSRPVPGTREDVAAVEAVGATTTFVAAGSRLWRYERAVPVLEFSAGSENEEDSALLRHLVAVCAFGDKLLVTLTSEGRLTTWSAREGRVLTRARLGMSCRTAIHPHTYLNKILIGGKSGALQLWNIRVGALVHDFQCLPKTADVVCLEQSPMVDVVAVGLSDGTTHLINTRFDKTLCTFTHEKDDGAVSNGDARSDVTGTSFLVTSEKQLVLATASASGRLALWSVNDQKLLLQLPRAHRGAVLTCAFLPGTKTLLTTGADNAVRVWELTGLTKLALLKERTGHIQSPTSVRFHPGGNIIQSLTSGGDARASQLISTSGPDLRSFHVALEHQSRAFSSKIHSEFAQDRHKDLNDLLTRHPIVALATSEARERDWGNVVTIHKGDAKARVWSFENRNLCAGGGALHVATKGFNQPNLKKRTRLSCNDRDVAASCTAAAISACGSLAFVGSETGFVSEYSLQSGLFRGTYPAMRESAWFASSKRSGKGKPPPGSVAATLAQHAKLAVLSSHKLKAPQPELKLPQRARESEAPREAGEMYEDVEARHDGSITGLCLDGLDECLCSAGSDGYLRFWSTSDHASCGPALNLRSPVSLMSASRDGGLCVVALEDLSVRVVDLASKSLVRSFLNAHANRVTDVCFAPDARLIYSTSADSTMRVWDVPSAKCVEWVEFSRPATSVSVNPTNDLLATSHEGESSICLWSFDPKYLSESVTTKRSKPVRVRMACDVAFEDDDDRPEEEEEEGADAEEEIQLETDGVDAGAISLTSNTSKWYTLVHLELIKLRNKPVAPPTKPTAAPFFLPSTANELDAKKLEKPASSGDDAKPAIGGSDANKASVGLSLQSMKSSLISSLEETVADASGDGLKELGDLFESMSPSAMDFEISACCWGAEDEEGSQVLGVWLDWVRLQLEEGSRFDMTQAVLARLLALHGETVRSRKDLKSKLRRVLELQKERWQRLSNLLAKTNCLVDWYTSKAGAF